MNTGYVLSPVLATRVDDKSTGLAGPLYHGAQRTQWTVIKQWVKGWAGAKRRPLCGQREVSKTGERML